ncbi:DNA polymerase III subunit delta [Lacrimispora sp.]|jgi:DNA polymerase-3 subunit delta|uniref:DNA polymerase III subunit delta n=1 Tax=Lacrimispora sp. TaxID=2719234 RepID=UPI0029E3A657|nr:polymerase subunit delta [Lacrimispora sp.]
MQTLNQDIKDRSFKPVYLLYGEEAFLKNSYKNQLKSAITQGDTMNFNQFGGKSIDVKELISLADTMPFFSEKRMILVEDSGFFKSPAEELVSYLPQIPDTTCMVFVESEVDKRGRMFKKIKELGYAAEMERQDIGQLAKWAGTLLSREGKKVTGQTMELFLSMTGDDMENIRMELEKLISFTLGREVITNEDVAAICTERTANKIFEMVNSIVNRQTKKALALYEDLLTLKEPPMRILFLIARQFNQLLQVKELMGKGMDKSGIASRLKIPPFAAGKLMPQARTFSKEQILSYVNTCVEAEEAVKTGQLSDRLAVELLLTAAY